MELTKIRDITPEIKSEAHKAFMKALDEAALMVLGQPLEQMQQTMLLRFIASQFRDMSANDIRKAIEMYAGGKLKADADKKVKMSAEYLGSVLYAYRLYKRESEHKMRCSTTKAEKTPQIDSKSVYENLIKFVTEKKTLPEWGNSLYASAFEYAESKGIIALTGDEKFEFAEKCDKKLNNQKKKYAAINNSIASLMISECDRILENKKSFANYCRAEMMKEFLKLKYEL